MPHVILTGERTGTFVVTDERPDGSLASAAAGARLLAPEDEG